MKYSLFILAIFIHVNSSFCQSFQIDWRNCFGHIGIDEANDVVKTNSGYYILGTANERDIWLIKTDLEGNHLWDKKFGGSKADYSISLIPISNAQFYIVGASLSSDGDVTYDPYPNSPDYWIVKIDSSGNKIWDKIYGGNMTDQVWSGCYSANDEVVIAGWSDSNDGDVLLNYGIFDMWVLKLDSTGNKVWNTIIGTDGQDIPYTIKQTSDKGYITGGTSLSITQPSGNIPCVDPYKQSEMVITKLDSLGNIEWSRCYGGSENEALLEIIELSDGYLAACTTSSNDGDLLNSGYHIGYWNSGAPTADTWIVKLDFEGNIQWQKCYGGSKHESPSKIFLTEKGYRVFNTADSHDGDVVGNNSITDDYPDIWTFEIDSVGNLLSGQCFGDLYDESIFNGVFKISDAQYAIACQSITFAWSCVEEFDIVLFKITDTLFINTNVNPFPSQVKVYPNPAHSGINFENSQGMPLLITVFDALGIKKEEFLLSPGNNAITIDNYSPGVYHYQYSYKGIPVTGKFVVY